VNNNPFNRVERWAGVLTSAYLSVFLVICIARGGELISLPLNELGDFAAGVFGPIAFLWLVLGYRQQGRELNISSNALTAQVEELKNTVEYQRIAAERQDRMADPLIQLKYLGERDCGGRLLDFFQMTNAGDYCSEVQLNLISDVEGVNHIGSGVGMLPSGVTKEVNLPEPINMGGIILIQYRRRTGTKGRSGYSFAKFKPEGLHVLSPVNDEFLELVIKNSDLILNVPAAT
jgi:hypothetical protein